MRNQFFLRSWRSCWQAALCMWVLWLASTALWAQSAQPEASIQLRHFIKEVQQAQGEFTQQTISADGKAQPEQAGQFAFDREKGQFRWQIDTPYEQLILADGQHLIQYDPDLSQATRRGLEHAVGDSPAAILFGSRRIDEGFELEDQKPDDGLQWLRATPKGSEAGFQHVDMGFREGLPERLLITDGFGQRTEIVFEEIQPDASLAADMFVFTAPEGVDVIDLQP